MKARESRQALLRVAVLLSLLPSAAVAQVAVFWQPGFPTVASQPVNRDTLSAVLDPVFLDLKSLQAPGALEKTKGRAVPPLSAVIGIESAQVSCTSLEHYGR
jgi:hypothetical protein